MGRKNECLFPGSFDPVTKGHMDVIRRARALYDTVYVGVLHNPDKPGCFPAERRVEFLERACAGLDGVRVLAHEGLMVELAARLGVRAVIRGARTGMDWESEAAMARVNRTLDPDVETLILPAAPMYEQVSASVVRQIAGFGGDISAFVPEAILRDVREWFARERNIG